LNGSAAKRSEAERSGGTQNRKKRSGSKRSEIGDALSGPRYRGSNHCLPATNSQYANSLPCVEPARSGAFGDTVRHAGTHIGRVRSDGTIPDLSRVAGRSAARKVWPPVTGCQSACVREIHLRASRLRQPCERPEQSRQGSEMPASHDAAGSRRPPKNPDVLGPALHAGTGNGRRRLRHDVVSGTLSAAPPCVLR
jgi:hypothetical protein